MIATTSIYRTQAPRDDAEGPVVFIVDGDFPVRSSLELLVDGAGWHAEGFASAGEFLAYPRPAVPSCLLLDVNLPGVDGLDLQRLVAADRPDMPVIFMTRHADVSLGVRAMKAGALDFLVKPIRHDVLLAALDQALERSRRAVAREMKMRILRRAYALLTPREREVMMLVVSGLLNKQVAGELGISEITVKAHRGQVMRKMNADSLPALVNMVSMLGLAVATA